MLSDFTIETASELVRLQETVDFPVQFDEAWQWLEYSRKDNAKVALLACDFVEGVDFLIVQGSDNHSTSRLSPQEKAAKSRKENISLTVDCFKMWGMMAGTEKGKQIRRYFLECERMAIAATKTPKLPPRHPDEAAKSVADAIDFIHQKLVSRDPRLAEVLIDHAMRGIDHIAILPPGQPKLGGCVEIAKKLGFKVGKDESSLGRFVGSISGL